MPEVSTMKPEPSEVVLCGCTSPPPGPPCRFLKKSSKNSSNGEPGGNFGIAPLSVGPFLASTVCEVEMLTTASITFSATSAMPSGPRAKAGGVHARLAAPRQIAANQGRRRRVRAGIAAVISDLSVLKSGPGLEPARNALSTVRPNRVTAQAPAGSFMAMSARQIRRKTGRETVGAAQFGVDPRQLPQPPKRTNSSAE